MIRVEREKLAFYQFLGLQDFPGLIHFILGREGGVSVGGQTALNLGFMDEDRENCILINRMLLAETTGCGVDDFILGKQKHTTYVEVETRVQRGRGRREKATRLSSTDALITRETDVCQIVLAADTPVLLYDPRVRVIAAVHVGWRGSEGRITAETVERMREEFCGNRGAFRVELVKHDSKIARGLVIILVCYGISRL